MKLMENPTAFRNMALIFLIAFILRIIYLVLMQSQYTSLVILHLLEDSQTYISIAEYFMGINVAGADDLLLAGPGYGLILAGLFKIFGFTSWPILIIQIILSSAGCVLIYKIALLLSKNSMVSLIAGILAAISLTSISLSAAVLTDCLFFSMLALSIYLYFLGLQNGLWKYFIFCGVILGAATLVRSIGIFFPIVLIFIAFLFPLDLSRLSRKQMLIKSILTGFLIIIIALPWAIKNKTEHGLFTVSETGALAARNYLASRVIFEAEKSGTLIEIRDWMAAPKTIHGVPETAAQRHDHAVAVVKETFSRYPGTFIRVFFKNIWENIGALSTIHSLQIPRLRTLFDFYTGQLFTKGTSRLTFFMSLIGFILFFGDGKKREALILALIYLYFAFLSGFTYWQGSRIFYPGQLAWSILMGFCLYKIALAIQKFRAYLAYNR